MRSSSALGEQRKLNDRDNMTGYRRADIYMQRVGAVVCSILVLICTSPGIVKGIKSIIGVISGKDQNNSDFNSDNNRRHQGRW